MTTSSDNRQSTRHAFEEDVEFIAPKACAGKSIDLAAGGIGADSWGGGSNGFYRMGIVSARRVELDSVVGTGSTAVRCRQAK